MLIVEDQKYQKLDFYDEQTKHNYLLLKSKIEFELLILGVWFKLNLKSRCKKWILETMLLRIVGRHIIISWVNPFIRHVEKWQSCSIKKGVLENFAKFTGKHMCQSLF